MWFIFVPNSSSMSTTVLDMFTYNKQNPIVYVLLLILHLIPSWPSSLIPDKWILWPSRYFLKVWQRVSTSRTLNSLRRLTYCASFLKATLLRVKIFFHQPWILIMIRFGPQHSYLLSRWNLSRLAFRHRCTGHRTLKMDSPAQMEHPPHLFGYCKDPPVAFSTPR